MRRDGDTREERWTGERERGRARESAKGKSKTGGKTRNQRQAQKLRNLHRRVPLTILGFMMAGVMMKGMMNGMMTGVRLDGTKVGNKRMTILQAHFH